MPPVCVSITYLQVVYVTVKVSALKTIAFSAFNLQDKVNIINLGRPTPAMSITKVQAHYKSREVRLRKDFTSV